MPARPHVPLELKASNTIAWLHGAENSLDLHNDISLLNERLVAAHFPLTDDANNRRTANADASVAHYLSIFSYWNPAVNVVMGEGMVKTMDCDAVSDRVESAVGRFESDMSGNWIRPAIRYNTRYISRAYL